MNYFLRITKYNPQYRNIDGFFVKNEWTSYSDIEKQYNNIKFCYEEYLKIETLYINAIKKFMSCCNINSLQISELEKSNYLEKDVNNNAEMIDLFYTIKNNDWLVSKQIERVCQLILRERLWCKLINDQIMYVHFGYDFYMYIGTYKPCYDAIVKTESSGLFVEPYKSPYNK